MRLFILSFFLTTTWCWSESTIDTTDRYAYSANTGWIDFVPFEDIGVAFTEAYLSGYAYSANFGWIHFGDGSPDNGYSYSNTSSTDYGVNLDPAGNLTGYAYGANVGWIQFEQVQGRPRLNFFSGALKGNAYGANIGWIALDTTFTDLTTALSCPDSDFDGIADHFELEHFGDLTTANATTDQDVDGSLDQEEYLAMTDPNDPSSRFEITNLSVNYVPENSVDLTFTSSPNRLYVIEFDDDFQGTWSDSGFGTFAPSAGTSTTRSFKVTLPNVLGFRVNAHKPLQP